MGEASERVNIELPSEQMIEVLQIQIGNEVGPISPTVIGMLSDKDRGLRMPRSWATIVSLLMVVVLLANCKGMGNTPARATEITSSPTSTLVAPTETIEPTYTHTPFPIDTLTPIPEDDPTIEFVSMVGGKAKKIEMDTFDSADELLLSISAEDVTEETSATIFKNANLSEEDQALLKDLFGIEGFGDAYMNSLHVRLEDGTNTPVILYSIGEGSVMLYIDKAGRMRTVHISQNAKELAKYFQNQND